MADTGDAAVAMRRWGVKGIAEPLTARDGDCHIAHVVAHVLPLTSGERRRAGASRADGHCGVRAESAARNPSLHEVISKHYRLTPTELRVLFAIVHVGGVPRPRRRWSWWHPR